MGFSQTGRSMKVSSFKLVCVHTNWMTKELMRQPAYVVSTIAFPTIFYLIFAVPESSTIDGSNYLMASFAAFGVFGVLFLQFGVSQAQERAQSWYQFLKSLPVRPFQLMTARFATAMFFAVVTALLVVVTANIWTEAQMQSHEWLQFALALFLPALPFCVMGLALGLWTNEKTSLPVGNLIYLPLSFLGGLWKPPEILPENLKQISEILPTRFYGDILWSVVKKQSFPWQSFWGLSVWTIFFFVLVFAGVRKDLDRVKA